LNFESDILYSKLWEKVFDSMKSENLIRLENEGDNAGCWVLPIENEDGKKLEEIFTKTKKIRKEIIKAGQDVGKPDFGRK